MAIKPLTLIYYFLFIPTLLSVLNRTEVLAHAYTKNNFITIAQLVAGDGSLQIRWLRSQQESCTTGKPHGSYSFKKGISGFLYPTQSDCKSPGGDLGKYRFIDTNGSKRCIGSMEIFFGIGGKADTIWRATSAVPKYSCDRVGKSDKYELYYKP
jgi:hypothetical protein